MIAVLQRVTTGKVKIGGRVTGDIDNGLVILLGVHREDKEEDIKKDYEYQRQNFYNLVERGNDAIEGILELAKESEHPRTYEVAGNLIKQDAEVSEKLGDLQEKMKKRKEVPDNAPKNVTNALFVGSTAELQKLIKGN